MQNKQSRLRDSATFDKVAESRNDGNANSFNDKIAKSLNDKSTHPQTPSAREGALRGVATFAREGAYLDCHDSTLRAESRNDKKKRLALSLATSAILASLSIDSAAAACRFFTEEGNQHLTCTGNMSFSELSYEMQLRSINAITRSTINLGEGGNTLRVDGSGTASATLTGTGQRLVIFRDTQASGVTFDFTFNNQSDSNHIYMSLNPNTSFGSTIAGLNVKGTANVNEILIRSGSAIIGNLDIGTSVTNLNITGGASVGAITGSNTISNLTLNDASLGSNIIAPKVNNATIGTLNSSIIIASDANSWNGVGSISTDTAKQQHLYFANATNIDLDNARLSIDIGAGVPQTGETYKLENLVIDDATSGGGVGGSVQISGAKPRGQSLTRANITSGQTAEILWQPDGRSFYLRADARNSYTASAYRTLALSYMRRNAMTQNVLDTMTTKTFHSDRYYNQEVELRLLQYDLSRLTNRSSKFSKTTRKNAAKVDKVREKMAKLTLEQSKGQNLDKGYNNYELIDQLDAIFIPYTGRRDWRFFALPYATHSYVDFGSSQAMEYAGGAIFGIQRNLRASGIFGGYMGYEFTNTDTQLLTNDTRVQTHSLQAGLNYFKTFSVPAKVWEGFIKANIRGGVDLPMLNFKAIGRTISLESTSQGVSIPLMYSVGAEVNGGMTFYQYKRNSYLSPAVGLSYDMLSTLATTINKPRGANNYLPLGPDELTGTAYWHLPALSASVRYYKMWGNTFRTNLKAGIKYNMLNKQVLPLSLRAVDGSKIDVAKENQEITLPAVYGNLAFDFIWMIKKNHELSFGYDGLFYASTFAKKNTPDEQLKYQGWFNGVTTTLNFKYAYWFGGSDYVTDKDGNAVARSIAEGGKKKSKSKKSKKKKEKKSKKKVYYIDG
ncbi:hypothetical protein [Helicobacter sp. T3_23-1056]